MYLFCSQTINANEQATTVSIAVSEKMLSVFNEWRSNKKCWDITDFTAAHSNRSAAELVMLCRALYLGGIKFKLDIHQTQNYSQSLLLAQQKKVHIAGETVWKDQADFSRFYISPPMLTIGEVEKGIYTLKTHPMMELVKNAQDLTNYRGITINSWHHDWNILRQLTGNMVRAPSPDSIHKMIKHDQADFTLGEFNHNMSISFGDTYLFPIPNIKIAVNQSRHFIVRKGMNNSEKIISAINKGLLKMRAQGIIRNTYIKTGFISSKATNWKVLRPIQFDE